MIKNTCYENFLIAINQSIMFYMVEGPLCLVAGRGSRQRSPSRLKRHIHSLSNMLISRYPGRSGSIFGSAMIATKIK